MVEQLRFKYYKRRAEIWKVVRPVGVEISDNDSEGDLLELTKDSFIKMNKGERHRLTGLSLWDIVAAIWNIQMLILL